jgi:hypothetical protein
MSNIQPLLRAVISPNIHSPRESGAALARSGGWGGCEGESGVYYKGLKQIESSNDSCNQAKHEDLWSCTTKTIVKDEEERGKF